MNVGTIPKTEINESDFRTLFESAPGLYLILLPDLTIVAASDSYLDATMTKREEIVGHALFEIFPDNPDDPGATGTANLRASLNFVLQKGTSHTMAIQKYDIQRPDGSFEERFWSPLNKPVLNSKNEITYIIHRVEDVTDFVRLKSEATSQNKTTEDLRRRIGEMEIEIYKRADEIQKVNSKFIDERKKVENEFKESEERFRLVVETVKDYAIFMLDTSGHVISWNQGAEYIKGYKAEEIMGKHISVFYTEDDIRNGKPEYNLNKAKKFGKGEDEGWRLRKDGSRFWANVIFTALYDKAGTLKGFSKVTRDVTESQKIKEDIRQLNIRLEQRVEERTEELNNSEKKYRDLFQNNPMPMWVLDIPSYKFLDVNEAAIRSYGYNREEFLSMTALDIRPDEEKKRFLEVDRSSDSGPHSTGIWKHLKKDGTLIQVEVNVHRIMFEGRWVRLVLSNDVTEKKKAESQLKISENRFRSIIEQFPYPVVTYSPDGDYINANEAWEIMWQEKRENVKGYNIRKDPQLIASGLSKHVERAFAGEIAISEPYFYDPTLIGQTGRKRWMQMTLYPLKNTDAEVSEVILILQDVTANKEDEEKILASEVRFRSLIENNNDMMTLATPDGNVFYTSPSLTAILGYTQEEILSKPAFELIHPDDIPLLMEKVQGFINIPGKSFFHQQRLLHKNGKWIWCEGTITNMLHEPSVGALVSNFRDITDRKEIEENLLKSLKEVSDYKYALDQSCIVAITDQRGIISYVNENFCKISKYDEAELIGQDHRIINSGYHPKGFIKNLWVTIANGKIWKGELKNKAKDGTHYWVDTTIIPFLNEEGKPYQYVAIRADITSRKQVEDDIHKLNEDLEDRVKLRTTQLETVNNELEAFSYSISHDLRAPLRAINGYTRILKEDFPDQFNEERERVLHVIMDNTKKMGQLIDDLLAFSRLGRKDISKSNLFMNNIVEQIVTEIKQTDPSSNFHLKLHFLPDAKGDYSMIRQVWWNLIGNAIKYSSSREQIEIEIGSEETKNDITYYIRDNGVGFDMQYTDKLFGVFQRLHDEKEFDGTGVGLAIVKRIINKFGGNVWAEGKVGEGATFYFTLPK